MALRKLYENRHLVFRTSPSILNHIFVKYRMPIDLTYRIIDTSNCPQLGFGFIQLDKSTINSTSDTLSQLHIHLLVRKYTYSGEPYLGVGLKSYSIILIL